MLSLVVGCADFAATRDFDGTRDALELMATSLADSALKLLAESMFLLASIAPHRCTPEADTGGTDQDAGLDRPADVTMLVAIPGAVAGDT